MRRYSHKKKTGTLFFTTAVSLSLLILKACASESIQPVIPKITKNIGNAKTLTPIVRYDRGNFNIFDRYSTEETILQWHHNEHTNWGSRFHINYARNKRFKNTVIMQRSGRKRLYDQNIFLAALFNGRIQHKKWGSLDMAFDKSIFIDIGSGILCGKGAPTVRDIFEDHRIWTHLDFIIATDINGPDCSYIDTYRIEKGNLPFPVKKIGMSLIWKRHFRRLTDGLLKDNTAIILRSANSGPDLYYEPHDVISHFRAIIGQYKERSVLYFYSKFILLKHKDSNHFENLGEIDSSVGLSHNRRKWEKINWSKRKLEDLFTPNQESVKISTAKKN